jgi:hypothetical protein
MEPPEIESDFEGEVPEVTKNPRVKKIKSSLSDNATLRAIEHVKKQDQKKKEKRRPPVKKSMK